MIYCANGFGSATDQAQVTHRKICSNKMEPACERSIEILERYLTSLLAKADILPHYFHFVPTQSTLSSDGLQSTCAEGVSGVGFHSGGWGLEWQSR